MSPAQWSALQPRIRKWFFLPWWRYYPVAILGVVLIACGQTRWGLICLGIFFAAFSLLLIFTGVVLIYRPDKKRGYAMIVLGLIATAFSLKVGLSK
jgi:hypothetical protein